jgi:hypothetical protein
MEELLLSIGNLVVNLHGTYVSVGINGSKLSHG